MEFPEGATNLDPDEMEGLKYKHVSTRGELDELEQASITNGMTWLSKQKNPDMLSEAFIRELHKRLFGDVWKWAGSFRDTEKNIGVEPYQIGIHLRNLLDDVKFWIENDTYPPKEIAARLHHRLVAIHLFPNGNGRHSRIMADAVLTKMLGCPPINWSGGFKLENRNVRRTQYIEALRSADRHDLKPLLKFVEA